MGLRSNVKDAAKRATIERKLKKAIADSILSENKLTIGNLNDYANLALRCGDTDANALTDWFNETFTESDNGTVFDVVITTKSDADENADYVYETKSGFAANLYKKQ